MDEDRNERERGITISPKWYQLKLDNGGRVVLVDTPGHRDFMKSFITAICGCQCAILVVAAPLGEFEAGFSKTGQTREHLLIAFTMGIKNLVIVISKMGKVSQDRYNEIAGYIIPFATKVGFKDIQVVPADSIANTNVCTTDQNALPWYKGPTVAQAVMEAMKKSNGCSVEQQPFRMAVSKVFKIGGIGPVVVGMVISGTLKEGQNMYISPSLEKPDPFITSGNWKCKHAKKIPVTKNEPIKCVVKQIEYYHEKVHARPGMFVGINFQNSPTAKTKNSLSIRDLKRGQVVTTSLQHPTKKFRAMIVVLEDGPFHVKYTPFVFLHTEHVPCRVTKIIKKLDRKTGKSIPLDHQIKRGEAGVVDFEAARHVSIFAFSDCPMMGRLVFYDNRKVVAVGKVLPTMIPWELARFVWAGHMKNPKSPFSRLPRDMIREILRS